ncbi:MAG TPA: T9SS type A sorting domain-containing protein [Flavisolibacter sp.]|nr:T9SS type A sorting domain-containing protein [Flavisolibacter sp.]
MKNPKYLSVLIGMLMLFLGQQADAQVQTARYTSITSNTKAFYEYLPQGYSATSTSKYPMILFLHGMGELGDGSPTNLPKVLRNGPPKLINNGTFPTSFTVNGQTFKFIVISPQFVDWPTSADIDAVITYAINNYNVDPTRVYLTGLSMGGGAVWEYAGNEQNANYPKRLAGIAPICGAAYPSVYRGNIIANNNIPVWAFHNDGDPTAPVFYTNDFVKYINSTIPAPNPLARKTIFAATGHDAWTQAYNPGYRENNMNVYEWMLQYKKGVVTTPSNVPPVANAGADKSITLPANSVAMTGSGTDADGSIASYTWSKVAGPTQYTLSSTTIASPTLSNLVAGTYTFRLTVKDNAGATAADDVNITVNSATTTPPPTGGATRTVKVNLYGGSNAYGDATWNNWNTSGSLNSASFKYTDGTASTISASLNQQSGVSDNGTTITTTMAPKEVVRYASYSTSNRTLTISGLDNSKTYNLEFYASRTGATNNTTRFTIGSVNADVKTDNNTATTASFSALIPVSGKITVSISKLNTYNYLNGLTLTENGTALATTAAASVSTESMQTGLTVYPNPVQDRLLLQVNNELSGQMKVRLFDISGVAQKEFTVAKQAGSSQTYLSIGDLKAGTYTLTVQLGDWTESTKISKL